MLSFHFSKFLHLLLSQKYHYPLHILLFIFFLNLFYLFSHLRSHILYDCLFYCILCLCKSIPIFVIKLNVNIILHAPCCKSYIFQDKAQGMLLGSSQQIFPDMNLQFSIFLCQHEYFIISGHFQYRLTPIRDTWRVNPEVAVKISLLILTKNLVLAVVCDLVLDLMKKISLLLSA